MYTVTKPRLLLYPHDPEADIIMAICYLCQRLLLWLVIHDRSACSYRPSVVLPAAFIQVLFCYHLSTSLRKIMDSREVLYYQFSCLSTFSDYTYAMKIMACLGVFQHDMASHVIHLQNLMQVLACLDKLCNALLARLAMILS